MKFIIIFINMFNNETPELPKMITDIPIQKSSEIKEKYRKNAIYIKEYKDDMDKLILKTNILTINQ